jgi:hypothetical protein
VFASDSFDLMLCRLLSPQLLLLLLLLCLCPCPLRCRCRWRVPPLTATPPS